MNELEMDEAMYGFSCTVDGERVDPRRVTVTRGDDGNVNSVSIAGLDGPPKSLAFREREKPHE